MRSIHRLEVVVLALVAASVLFGVAAAWVDVRWFEQVYVIEDGPIEWGTAIAQAVGAGVAAWTVWHAPQRAGPLFRVTWIGLALLCFFAAGEEISWGQRLFHVASPEFFVAHNAQHETNLHNLVVDGVKINRLVFSKMLTVAAGFYLVVLPWLYRRKAAFARFVDLWGVPVPTIPQVVAVIATFALISVVPSHERDELLEFGASAVFVLMLRFPLNVARIRARGTEAAPPQRAAAGR